MQQSKAVLVHQKIHLLSLNDSNIFNKFDANLLGSENES